MILLFSRDLIQNLPSTMGSIPFPSVGCAQLASQHCCSRTERDTVSALRGMQQPSIHTRLPGSPSKSPGLGTQTALPAAAAPAHTAPALHPSTSSTWQVVPPDPALQQGERGESRLLCSHSTWASWVRKYFQTNQRLRKEKRKSHSAKPTRLDWKPTKFSKML